MGLAYLQARAFEVGAHSKEVTKNDNPLSDTSWGSRYGTASFFNPLCPGSTVMPGSRYRSETVARL